ncbi:hypothetical protein GCK72_021423 [Caenorhabditis remanei]|uniref:F-box domain-containing protein n=1 Tax=Caenorhabditis remanei TaxID=31234 RepID=A0A6A5GI37_CAERE|nr:hypothetical protein GCK72_021423 [Caenorhabditis remanei]KAF1754858.1 hypothetical protein GCK72_021423 [Caenorhabditis remanei]
MSLPKDVNYNNPYILQMPELVMKQILEHVDFVSILKLRKVCHAFRNFIDDNKSGGVIKKILIRVMPDALRVKLTTKDDFYPKCEIVYMEKSDGCFIAMYKGVNTTGKYFKNGKFFGFFTEDFGFLLRNQNMEMEEIEVMICTKA